MDSKRFETTGDVPLIPCPCCNAEAKYYQWWDTKTRNSTLVMCGNGECGLATSASSHDDPEEAKRIAARKWNRRDGAQALVRELTDLAARWQTIIADMGQVCPSPVRNTARQTCESCLSELKEKLQKFDPKPLNQKKEKMMGCSTECNCDCGDKCECSSKPKCGCEPECNCEPECECQPE